MVEVGTLSSTYIELTSHYLREVACNGVPVFKTEVLHHSEVCLDAVRVLKHNTDVGTKTED